MRRRPTQNDPREPARGIGVWRFPEWFVVQEAGGGEERERSRRLVHRKALDDKGRFDGRPVVATRFVRACPKGHVDDLDWRRFVHGAEDTCRRQLWLDERGTSGDLADLVVRCECGKSRSLYEATQLEMNPLGTCRGARPWLGRNTDEDCKLPSRLLIRTASNAYFPQVVSVLSLPDRGSAVETAVRELWDDPPDRRRLPQILAVSEEEAEDRGEARAVSATMRFSQRSVKPRAARQKRNPSSRSNWKRCSPRPRALATTCPSIPTFTPAGCPIALGVTPSAATASRR